MELRLSLSDEPVSAELAARFTAVGLLRGEYIMRHAGQYITVPACQQRIQSYVEAIARVFHPRPVWYRTSELWSDEANGLDGNDVEIIERNPVLGIRGIRRGLQTKATFELELRTIAEVARSWSNLHILFPFVKDAAEFSQGADLLAAIGWPNRIGSMLEIPSAVLQAEKFVAAGATNLLVGLNDLSCLLLGAGRDEKEHEAVWWCIDHVRRALRGVEWGIAGNLSPEVARLAREHDVPYVSVHYNDLPSVCDIDARELPALGQLQAIKADTKRRIDAFERRRARKLLSEA
jgi:phosphoenolpyruvate synthase/pyruvate phosphate dikinase